MADIISSMDVDSTSEEVAAEQKKINNHKKARNCRYPGLDLIKIESDTGETSIQLKCTFKKLPGNSDTVRLAAGCRTRAVVAAEAAARAAEKAQRNPRDLPQQPTQLMPLKEPPVLHPLQPQ